MARRYKSGQRLTRGTVPVAIAAQNLRRANPESREYGLPMVPDEELLLIQGWHAAQDPPADWRTRKNDGAHNLPAVVKRLGFVSQSQGEAET